MANLDHSITELQKLLRAGNVAAADALVGSKVGDLRRTVAPDSVEGMITATAIAELQFVLGHDDVAERCLEPYSSNVKLLEAPLPAGNKLQLAEFHYSRFTIDKAISIGERILAEARSADDRHGVAEAHFYLARFRLRNDAYREANDECMLGLESLHRAEVKTDDDGQAVHWQTGRLLRVRGAALWQQGRLTEAKAVLYLACWILRQALGTAQSLHVGDALLSLGRLLRSDDVSRHAEAIAMLEEAARYYENHDLKLTRTWIDLARTRHNMALAHLRSPGGGQQDAASLFAASRDSLQEAFDIIKRKCQGQYPPKVWRRQRAEALLWRCWQMLETPSKNPKLQQARDDARAAVKESAEIRSRLSDQIEAQLALGHCEMELKNLQEARAAFALAYQQAETLKDQNPKLRVHACLSLAQLECRSDGNVQDALSHYDEAVRAVDSSEISSYLSAKSSAVQREIQNLATKRRSVALMVNSLEAPGYKKLDVLEIRARKWVVDSLGRNITNDQAGRALGVSERTIATIRSKAEELETAIKTGRRPSARPRHRKDV